MRHNEISDMMYTINNAESIGKRRCIVRNSKVARGIMKILKKMEFVKDFKVIENGRSGIIEIDLNSRINKAKALNPRFSVKNNEYEKWEKRYLPAKGFGILIVSTTKGLMTHEDAKANEIGGRIISYIY